MTKVEDFFLNKDKQKLFRVKYFPKDKDDIKAFVFLNHGLFEHVGSSYEKIILPLNEINCLVVGHDHIGHGKSEGDRGQLYDIETLVRDSYFDILDIKESYKLNENIPLFVYGHSLGGLISVLLSVKYPDLKITGLCLEAPCLFYPKNVSPVAITMGRFISRFISNLKVGSVEYEKISRDEAYLERLKLDPLYHHKGVTTRTGTALFNGIDLAQKRMNEVNVSILIHHGTGDTVTPIEGSLMLIEKARTTDITLVRHEGAFHQLRNEINSVPDQLIKSVVEWISAKI